MKTVLLVTFALASLFAYAQKETPNLPVDEYGRIIYSEVVYVDSLTSKIALFSRAMEWFAKTYKSSTNVIQMEDKETGKIVGKALMQVYHKALGTNYPSGYINYTISIYVKDGRYKYEITDLHHTGQYVSGGNRISDYGSCNDMINTSDKALGISYQKTYNYYLYQMDNNISAIIYDLKKFMETNSITIQNEDW